jgi:hypothetical protein
MMTKRVILIQQGTFNKNISVILLTYSGKTRISFPFPMMELVILVWVRIVFLVKKLTLRDFQKFRKCVQCIKWDPPLQIFNLQGNSECCANDIQTFSLKICKHRRNVMMETCIYSEVCLLIVILEVVSICSFM